MLREHCPQAAALAEFDELLHGDEQSAVARVIREWAAQRQIEGEERQARLWRLYFDARVAGVCREGALELISAES